MTYQSQPSSPVYRILSRNSSTLPHLKLSYCIMLHCLYRTWNTHSGALVTVTKFLFILLWLLEALNKKFYYFSLKVRSVLVFKWTKMLNMFHIKSLNKFKFCLSICVSFTKVNHSQRCEGALNRYITWGMALLPKHIKMVIFWAVLINGLLCTLLKEWIQAILVCLDKWFIAYTIEERSNSKMIFLKRNFINKLIWSQYIVFPLSI